MGSNRHYPQGRPARVLRVRGSQRWTSGHASDRITDQHSDRPRRADDRRMTLRAGNPGSETTARRLLTQYPDTRRDDHRAVPGAIGGNAALGAVAGAGAGLVGGPIYDSVKKNQQSAYQQGYAAGQQSRWIDGGSS